MASNSSTEVGELLHGGLCLRVQDYIEGIRKMYEGDWYAAHMRDRQMGVALYFIDKLALRAGHEKDEDEADTVGCCTLKVRLQQPPKP